MTLTTRVPLPLEGEWPEQGDWTYDDYARLPDDGWKYEVVDGVLYMSPSPSTRHQRAINVLSYQMTDFVEKGQLGQVYTAPIDVMLSDRTTPVRPDILYIAHDRLHIITEQTIDGPPDLVVEVLSPSNWLDDRRIKYAVYAEAGVPEYWIVDIRQGEIEVYGLQGIDYVQLGRYATGEMAASQVLSGFTADVDTVCSIH